MESLDFVKSISALSDSDVARIQKAANINGILFENQERFTIEEVASYFDVTRETVQRKLKEFEKNCSEILTEEKLKILCKFIKILLIIF